MFDRHGSAHGNRPQHMAQSIERDDEEKAKADARERREDRLDADSANDVDK